jgi:branched-chain amino acid transport system substrate-binding protein
MYPFTFFNPFETLAGRRLARGRVLLGVAVAAGFFAPVMGPYSGAAAATQIGVAGPSTGREQSVAEAIRQAAEATIKDINGKGGVLGEPLELMVLDDACTEGGAAAAAQTFIQKQVRLVVGHPCAKAALTAAGLYGPAGVMFIATASRHPRLTDKRAGKTIFRLSGRDDRQGAAAADWLAAQPGQGPIAVVHDKTSYSRTLATAVGVALLAKAQPPVLDLPITASENDYAATIKALVAAKPKAVFFAGYPAEANIIVTAARAAGLTAPVLGSESLATPDFTRQPVATDQAMSVLTRFAPLVALDVEASQSGSRLDAMKDAAATATAKAIRMWADAAVRSGNTSSETVSAALSSATTPDSNFETNGDARMPSYFPVYWDRSRWVGRQ